MLDRKQKEELVKKAQEIAKAGSVAFNAWLDSLSPEEAEFIIDEAFNRINSIIVVIPNPGNYMEN